MWVRNLFTLLLYLASVNFYLYELFYGPMSKTDARSIYYVSTAFVFLYLTLCDRYEPQCQFNTICKICITTNFFFFTYVLVGAFPDPVFYLFLLNGSVFAITIMILISFARNGYFIKT